MLVLTRRPGEAFQISNNITVTVAEVTGKKVRIAIDAPRDVPVSRIGGDGTPVAAGCSPSPLAGSA